MKIIDYEVDRRYAKSVAYFSMEFALHQALKIYSGGLGFLAGSHLRSAFDLRQNLVGVGILWSYGYYDQARDEQRNLKVEFRRKFYYFLKDLNTEVTVDINGKSVVVKAYLVPSGIFSAAPLILLSTDIDKNDYLSRTITHKLYDANEQTRIAQEIVLGIGGVRVLEKLKHNVEIYHMNEGHSVPLIYALYNKHKSIDAVREKVVFTTHTPEAAGNEEHDIHLLQKMGFFDGLGVEEVQKITRYQTNTNFSLTVAALKCAKIANGVSQMHGEVAKKMWSQHKDICEIIAITNAQSKKFWVDKGMIRAYEEHEDYQILARKQHLKRILFDEVANQTGKMFQTDVLTIVWARRFAEYKRPGLLKYDFARLENLITRTKEPIQIIWAGKPYPFDTNAINLFNELNHISKSYNNLAVLIGYELELSNMLKKGADIWLNTPRVTREASGTSGMSAAMNGTIHFSTPDGWHPEFCREGINGYTIPTDAKLSLEAQDAADNKAMMDILENEIIPTYYKDAKKWVELMKNSISDSIHRFNSDRMVSQYYDLLYNK
jgi:starch phosphorylase